jgi:hypothetical protein
LALHETCFSGGGGRGWLLFLALLLAFAILQLTSFFSEASPGSAEQGLDHQKAERTRAGGGGGDCVGVSFPAPQ